ncbi:MAG: hypothetical protein QF863_09530, partial [Pseudomonadales bacterium]|nr:hypothetical protein [Pseudomonadales bacterium]
MTQPIGLKTPNAVSLGLDHTSIKTATVTVLCHTAFAMLAAHRPFSSGSRIQRYEQYSAVNAQTSSIELPRHLWLGDPVHDRDR